MCGSGAAVCTSETMVGAAIGSRTAPKGGSAPEPLLCILLGQSPRYMALAKHGMTCVLIYVETMSLIDHETSECLSDRYTLKLPISG